jgi:hypothetical protein
LAAAVLSALAGCSHRQLLLVTEYSADSSRVKQAAEAISARMESENISHRLVVFNTSMRDHPTEAWKEGMARRAMMRVESMHPEIVFLAGDHVAETLAPKLHNTAWRVIFFDVKQQPRNYEFTVATNATGVHEEVAIGRLYALIKKLVPSARRVGVLAGDSPESRGVINQIRAHEDSQLAVSRVVTARHLAEWMKGVQELQDEADVLIIASYGSVLREPFGPEAVPPRELLELTGTANRLPDFTFWPEHVGPNTVMAAETVPIGAQADLAAEMGARVLAYGADIKQILIASVRDRARVISVERADNFKITVPDVLLKSKPIVTVRGHNWVERFKSLFVGEKQPVAIN